LNHFAFAGEQFLQNDVRSISNSQLGEALDDSDTDEDVTDNVFIAPGEEEKEDHGR
jgi:hypothetical protein